MILGNENDMVGHTTEVDRKPSQLYPYLYSNCIFSLPGRRRRIGFRRSSVNNIQFFRSTQLYKDHLLIAVVGFPTGSLLCTF